MRFNCGSSLAQACILMLALSFNGVGASSCDPIRTFGDGKQPLREIFVSPTGSNSTGNGTQANPFQTIIRACKGFSP